ncbi:MAG: hypothetical protein M3512_04810 [Bacteroidota bacterium]|nr:hypothetical protein [Bacteroidota bacterium]
MKTIYLVSALALTLTFGCNSTTEKETSSTEATEVTATETLIPMADVEKEEDSTATSVSEEGSVTTDGVDGEITE